MPFWPDRIYLDTCTFQALYDCGDYISGEDSEVPKPEEYINGKCPQVMMREDYVEILQSMRNIFSIQERCMFDWIVSPNCINEIDACKDRAKTNFALDIYDHSMICLTENPPSELADEMAAILSGGSFGFLSKKDKKLLIDAAAAECDTFLTIEKRLPKMSSAIYKRTQILVTTPPDLWEMMTPNLKGL